MTCPFLLVNPRMVGFPGLIATPCRTTEPTVWIASIEKSFCPAEDPAFSSTRSHSAIAVFSKLMITSALSLATGYTLVSQPQSCIMPEKMVELNSMMSPGFGFSLGATSSLPVGIIPTIGLQITGISSTPEAKRAPSAEGLSSVKLGTTISPAAISSPIWRTCCQGVAAPKSCTPCSVSITSSTITTQS